jgi:hypothetical protein
VRAWESVVRSGHVAIAIAITIAGVAITVAVAVTVAGVAITIAGVTIAIAGVTIAITGRLGARAVASRRAIITATDGEQGSEEWPDNVV